MFVYFSQLIDCPVIDAAGNRVGQIYDLIVKPSEVYPLSSHLIVRKGFPNRSYALVRWQDIQEITTGITRLKVAASALVFSERHNNKEELTLRRDILDQQVVDTANHKVIRVNDIHLLVVDHSLMVAHVDISLRGLVRRLGLERITDWLVARCNKNAEYLRTEHLLSWKHIQPLSINPVSMTIKVNFPSTQLNRIPAADLGEIFLDLTPGHQMALFKSLDIKTRSQVFMNIDFKTQKSIIEELRPEEVVQILNSIPADEVIDFLMRLPKEGTEKLLGLMESKQAKKLSELLGYSSDSAGGLMTTEYLAFPKDTPIETVLRQIRERAFKVEPAQFVYIIDEGHRLIGSTNFRRLMIAHPSDPVQTAAFPKAYCVRVDSSVKEVAYLMEKYKYPVIPVVDHQQVLQGIITVDDILSQLIAFAWRRMKKIRVTMQKTLPTPQ